MNVVVIANPKAAAGATARRQGQLESLSSEFFGKEAEVWWTEAVGDANRLARRAVEGGAGLVVAVGGDGTISEIAAGMLGGSDQTDVSLGIVSSGTGGDLVRGLGLSRDMRTAFAGICSGVDVRVDLLDLAWEGRRRRGINVCGIGLAGEVVGRVNRGSKKWGGTLSFLGSTLSALAAWKPPQTRIRWEEADGREDGFEGKLANAFVANGRFCGGGMCVSSTGSMSDGLLDLVVIPQLPLARMVSRMPELYGGRGLSERDGVIVRSVRRVWVESVKSALIPIDLDGEVAGEAPVVISVLPSALSLRLPEKVTANLP